MQHLTYYQIFNLPISKDEVFVPPTFAQFFAYWAKVGGTDKGGDEGSAVVEQIPEFQEQASGGEGFYGQFQV